jgi:hypothetical protein
VATHCTVLRENIARVDGLPAGKQILSVHGGHVNDLRIILASINVPRQIVDNLALLIWNECRGIGICLLDTHLVKLVWIIRNLDFSDKLVELVSCFVHLDDIGMVEKCDERLS